MQQNFIRPSHLKSDNLCFQQLQQNNNMYILAFDFYEMLKNLNSISERQPRS